MSYNLPVVRSGSSFALYEGEGVGSGAGGRAVDGYSLVRKEKCVPGGSHRAQQKVPWFGHEKAPIVLAVADEDWHWGNNTQCIEKCKQVKTRREVDVCVTKIGPFPICVVRWVTDYETVCETVCK